MITEVGSQAWTRFKVFSQDANTIIVESAEERLANLEPTKTHPTFTLILSLKVGTVPGPMTEYWEFISKICQILGKLKTGGSVRQAKRSSSVGFTSGAPDSIASIFSACRLGELSIFTFKI